MRILYVLFVIFFCAACSSSTNQENNLTVNDTIVALPGDTGKYRSDLPLDALAKFWHLDTLARHKDAFGFRVWIYTASGVSIVSVQETGNHRECSIKTYSNDSKDTIILRRNLEISRPFSGWNLFIDSLKKFRVPAADPSPLYWKYAQTTEADGVEVEQFNRGVYQFRKYRSPEYYRNVIYECMEVAALLDYLEFELGVEFYDGWKDQFVDQRVVGVDSCFQQHPLYHIERDNLENPCTQEIQFVEVPKSVSLFTAFNCDVYNSTDDTLEYYIGLDAFLHDEWRASFLDIDGRPPHDNGMIHQVAGKTQDRVMYEDIFSSLGMGSNFRYSLDGQYRLVIYYRRKGDVSFKRCAGNRVKIRNRVDIYKSTPRILSVTLDTIAGF